jgi:membrane-associated phospholipid phosphatase
MAWAGVLAVVLAALATAVNLGALHLSDNLLLAAAQAPAGPVLDLFMSAVSFLGRAEVTGIMALALVLTARSARPLGWERLVPLGLFIALVLVELGGKSLVHQPAPPISLLRGARLPGVDVPTAYGFPSGHMTRSTLIFGLVALRRVRGGGNPLWLWGCVAAVWLMGYSRVYLGEHWPADVAGGILLGGIGLALCLAVSPRGSVGDLPAAAGDGPVKATPPA